MEEHVQVWKIYNQLFSLFRAHKAKSLTSGQRSPRAARKLSNELIQAMDMYNKSAKFEKPRIKTLACREHTKSGLIHLRSDSRIMANLSGISKYWRTGIMDVKLKTQTQTQ